jgi:hypothetical protein
MSRKPWISLSIIIAHLNLISLVTPASAETYKCVENGVSTYTQTRCPDGAIESIHKSSNNISDKDYQQAVKASEKEKAELNKLVSARKKEEENLAKEMRKISAKNEKNRQKCASLQLSAKWAREDLANATPKTIARANARLKRANEKAELQCKSGAG